MHASLCKKIKKTTTAVSHEIRKNCTHVAGVHPRGNDCHMATSCKRKHLCGDKKCERKCVHCKTTDCRTICRQYNNSPCKQLSKPPYVCNVCGARRVCKADRAYYIAAQAEAVAKRRYSESRRGPQLDKEEMTALDELVSPLILKGQPLTHIFSSHSAEIPVSQRTLYNYIEDGHLKVSNLDLRRKVGYKPMVPQDFSGQCVGPIGHISNVLCGVSGHADTLGNESAQQLVVALICALFPGRIWMGKVNLGALDCQFCQPCELRAIVPGHTFENDRCHNSKVVQRRLLRRFSLYCCSPSFALYRATLPLYKSTVPLAISFLMVL